MIANLTTRQQLVASAPVPCAGGAYTLPIATPTILGGVKIGANVSVTADGTISVAPPGAVASVFGRAGVVVAASGDYTAAQITNAVDQTQSYSNPSFVASIAWGKVFGFTGVTSAFGRVGAVSAQSGDYNISQITNGVSAAVAYNDPAWINSLSWSKITGAPATGVSSVFTRSGAVVAVAGDYTAAQVTNAVDQTQSYPNPAWITSYAWSKLAGVPSNVANAVDATQTYSDPSWLTALSWSKIIGAPGVGSYQTPWLQDIAAATFRLLNAGNVGVGSSLATAPMASPGNYVQVGSDSGVTVGRVMVCSSQPTSGQEIGEISFVNFANAAGEKRVAYIAGQSSGTSGNSANIQFAVAFGGAPAVKMQLNNNGALFAGTTIGGVDFFNFLSGTVNQGLMLATNLTGGGSIALRSNASVNMIQSGNQTNASAQDLRITSNNAGTVWMTFQASTGNVGVFTASPTRRFTVAEQANPGNIYMSFNDGGGEKLAIGSENASSSKRFVIYDSVAAAYRLVMDTSGNFGIGTSSPAFVLSVRAGASGNSVFNVNATATGIELRANNDANSAFSTLGLSASSYVFGALPGTNPGAGTKQLWYDPADSNRVKFAA
jgi:hypothetical protein